MAARAYRFGGRGRLHAHQDALTRRSRSFRPGSARARSQLLRPCGHLRRGRLREIFAQAVHMSPSVRETLILQSKKLASARACTISQRNTSFPRWTAAWRLKTDYLDVLLHRPDALVEPEEVAQAFDVLEAAGKVRYFGVSNQKPMEIRASAKVCAPTAAPTNNSASRTPTCSRHPCKH